MDFHYSISRKIDEQIQICQECWKLEYSDKVDSLELPLGTVSRRRGEVMDEDIVVYGKQSTNIFLPAIMVRSIGYRVWK